MPPKGKAKKSAPTAAELAEARRTAAIVPCRASEKEGDTWSQFEERIQGLSRTAIADNFDNAVPVLTKEDLEAILPETLPDSSFNDDWTREEEAALQQAWLGDPRYSDPLRGEGKDGSMLKGFKLLVRMFRMSPLEIISPKYRLEWDTAAKDVGPHWSAMFTNKLVNVAMHPLWDRDVKLFTTALQYAVLLRTEDTRPWLYKKPVDTPFFTTFQEVIGELRDKPISEVHEEVRSRLKRCGHPIPIFSEFLLSLESVVEMQPKTAIHDRSKKVYPVGLVDIKAVIEALDATDNFGFPAFLPLGFMASKVFEKRLRSEFDPPSSRDLAGYMRRAWVGYRRIEAQFNKGEQWEESRPVVEVARLQATRQEDQVARQQLQATYERKEVADQQLQATYERKEVADQQIQAAYERKEAVDKQVQAAYERKENVDQQVQAAYERKEAVDQQLQATYERKEVADQQLQAIYEEQEVARRELRAMRQQQAGEFSIPLRGVGSRGAVSNQSTLPRAMPSTGTAPLARVHQRHSSGISSSSDVPIKKRRKTNVEASTSDSQDSGGGGEDSQRSNPIWDAQDFINKLS